MAKPDGRIERGQSIKKAFSANKWNDLCDAADIVHGRRGGMTTGGSATHDRTTIVAKAASSVRAGSWVFITPQQGDIDLNDATNTAGRAQMFRSPIAHLAYPYTNSTDTRPFVGMAVESATSNSFFRVQVSGAVFTFVAIRHRHHGFASFTENPRTVNDDSARVFPFGSGASQTNYIPTSAISGQMRIAWFDDTNYVAPQLTGANAAICPAIVVL